MENPLFIGIAGWLFVTGLAGFTLMAVDKKRATRQSRRRVPERTFLILAALGGVVGVVCAISALRHKINKPGFVLSVAGIGAIWLLLLWILFPLALSDR